ncbi:MAG TPA: hypothetical protein VM307_00040 [Egibacteraceae bacterium]|nr:hypothetical protein [Egibacteraceae bacterium]
MRRPRTPGPERGRPGPTLLRSGFNGIGAVTVGVVLMAAVAAVITAVVAALT